jgi:hypothetical protein
MGRVNIGSPQEAEAMPYIIAAAFILLGGALSFGMAGKKLKRRRRPKQTALPDPVQGGQVEETEAPESGKE